MSNIVKTEIKANNESKVGFATGPIEEAPRVLFSALARVKMNAIVQTNAQEVGWYGIVDKSGENEFTVRDIVYPKQVLATFGTCEFDESDAIEAAMIVQGGPANVEKLKFWGHSHHTMGVGPSGQDESQIMRLATRHGENQAGMFFRGIFNKRGDVGLTALCSDTKRRWDGLPWGQIGELPGAEKDLEDMMAIIDGNFSIYDKRVMISNFKFSSEEAVYSSIKELNEKNIKAPEQRQLPADPLASYIKDFYKEPSFSKKAKEDREFDAMVSEVYELAHYGDAVAQAVVMIGEKLDIFKEIDSDQDEAMKLLDEGKVYESILTVAESLDYEFKDETLEPKALIAELWSEFGKPVTAEDIDDEAEAIREFLAKAVDIS